MSGIPTQLADYASLPDDFYGLAQINQSIDLLMQHATYLDASELVALKHTCHFAAIAHDGQKRKSGEPYICHPIAVAQILAEMVRFDLTVLQAGVLHDVLEDCPAYTHDTLTKIFGETVTDLVDGVSKFEQIKDAPRETRQAQTFAKMVIAIEKDPRVIMIKLADRMHNMQTLGAMPQHKKGRIIHETLHVYVPIAERLGMYQFKTVLEELCFKNQYPWRYDVVEGLLENDDKRTKLVQSIYNEVLMELKRNNLSVDMHLRRRNIVNAYEKWKKSLKTKRDLDKASFPFVIIAENVAACYQILGVLHRLYKPINHRLADYIAVPKVNAYQSLHTSVILTKGLVANFQIRTLRMHYIAEQGIIAMYRLQNEFELGNDIEDDSTPHQGKPMMRFLSGMKSLQDVLPNPEDYYNAVKDDLSGDNIQVLTPKGEPMSLPVNATPIDFAYRLHSEMGDQVERVRVNDIEVGLDYQLKNEQTVEMVLNKHATPKVEWLSFVQTSHARSAIRYYFRSLSPEARRDAGKAALLVFFEARDIFLEDPDEKLSLVVEQFAESVVDLYEKVALGDIDLSVLFRAMASLGQRHNFTYHFTVRIDNRPNMLGQIVTTLGENHINIEHIESEAGFFKEQITFKFVINFDERDQLTRTQSMLKDKDFISYQTFKEVTHEQENH